MDGFGLIASIVQSIASLGWPVALILVAWLFREKLTELLPLLRLKHKDWEVSFRLNQAEQEVANLPRAQETPETAPTPEEKSRFEQIADVSPKAAILEARTDIEVAVRTLAAQHQLLSPKVQSTLGLTRLLRSRGIIDLSTSALLDDLRVLGNNAAHNSDIIFSKSDAIRYRSLADQAIAQLSAS